MSSSLQEIKVHLPQIFSEGDEHLEYRQPVKAFLCYERAMNDLAEVLGRYSDDIEVVKQERMNVAMGKISDLIRDNYIAEAELALRKIKSLNKRYGIEYNQLFVKITNLHALCLKNAGRLKESLSELQNVETICHRQGLDPSLIYMTMGRVYACLQNYKKAAHCSRKACDGFLKILLVAQPSEKELHAAQRESMGQESKPPLTKEQEELYGNLSISFYTNASHLEKIGEVKSGLESALEARQWNEKLTANPKTSEFQKTIEARISSLRQKLNNQKTLKDNNSLIQSIAEENLSKLRQCQIPETDHGYSPVDLTEEKTGKLIGSTAKEQQLKRSQSANLKKRNRANPLIDSKWAIQKKVQGKHNMVIKDPVAKKNYDPVKFRVTTLHLHNEYFHGPYSNGIKMYKSTCNNEKFYPYKALNPLPNFKEFEMKKRPESLNANKPIKRHNVKEQLKKEREELERMHQQEVNDWAEANELVGDSFDSQPGEVIDIYSPPQDNASVDNQKLSNLERQQEYIREHGQKPGTNKLQPENEVAVKSNPNLHKKENNSGNGTHKTDSNQGVPTQKKNSIPPKPVVEALRDDEY